MTTGVFITQRELNEIKRLYAEGVTQGEIARRLRISRRTVSRKLHDAEITPPANMWKPHEDRIMAEMVGMGKTYPEIAKALRRSAASVRGRIRFHGLQRHPERATMVAQMASLALQNQHKRHAELCLKHGGFPVLGSAGVWAWPNLKAAA